MLHGVPKASNKHATSTVIAMIITDILNAAADKIIQYQYSGKEKLNTWYKPIFR